MSLAATAPISAADVTGVTTDLFIGGRWLSAARGARFDVLVERSGLGRACAHHDMLAFMEAKYIATS